MKTLKMLKIIFSILLFSQTTSVQSQVENQHLGILDIGTIPIGNPNTRSASAGGSQEIPYFILLTGDKTKYNLFNISKNTEYDYRNPKTYFADNNFKKGDFVWVYGEISENGIFSISKMEKIDTISIAKTLQGCQQDLVKVSAN